MSIRKLIRKYHAWRALRKERRGAYRIVCDKDGGRFGHGFNAFLDASKFKQSLDKQESPGERLWRRTKTVLLVLLVLLIVRVIWMSLSGLVLFQ